MLKADLIAPVPDLLRRHAREQGAKIAYQDAGRSVSYAELERRTANLAGHMAERGIRPGESVAIYLPNSVAWVEACLAIVRAGAVAVPISAEAAPGEVEYRLTDADCRLVITSESGAALVEALDRPEPLSLISVDAPDDAPRSFSACADRPCAEAARDLDDIDAPAFIIYTSGTTGRPKGVVLTCRSMFWVTAACWAPVVGLCADDRVLSPLPLFHSYALNFSVLSVLAVGASEYLLEKYSTRETLRLLETGDFTVLPGVPTMFHYLKDAAQAQGWSKMPGLRVCVSAGAILPAPLNAGFEAAFGVPLLDGYGITETSTMVTMNSASATRIMGSCGLPLPGVALRLVDPVSLRDVDAGEEGELIVRGPNVMLGYHAKPEETAKALRNGWYHTGDLARADRNGFVTVTGRLKELIIRGGQNIAPAEIEEVILTLAGVRDCAVAGIPHPTLGEVPAVFIVPGEAAPDVEALLDHCRARLSSYKIPHVVQFVEEIPRTGSGKVLRFRLRELLTTAA
ncbi:class I adenylate-forming enzyme family protein [Aquabacter sp. P-9]|uniref:class I adenylate-forming enzyme family protein n=1 Tax=Aquabacter sediminis TaxID=3029197 RepID=UPI00237D3B97|nr:class I adenylate-forming enzyme family protein [Aquabacter sp. P-9]MDE1568339.1 class I adenylate-forming enzyme family protein [Aquabacter sp. P-9]